MTPAPAEAHHVTMTRSAYDTVAASYAELLEGHLADATWDRMTLAAFAELVRGDGGGRVGDFGCGPGRITAHLAELGLDAFGVDLSSGMVAEARRRHPGLSFEVGSLAALPLADGGLAGAVAWYSLIHTPLDELPVLVAELARVLRPGGRLLVAFQVGDEVKEHYQAYGHEVRLDSYRLDVDHLATLLNEAGIVVTARVVRGPVGVETTSQAYLLCQRDQP